MQCAWKLFSNNIDNVNNNTKSVFNIDFNILSSNAILSWSCGEVVNALCLDRETNKPVLNGLFCPRIFGPINQYECLCDKPLLSNSLYCKTCGLDFNINQVTARTRFGHIQLAVPVVHIWFYKLVPDIVSILLDKPTDIIESIIKCKLHVIIKTPSSKFKVGQLINSKTYEMLWESKDKYKILSGGIAILELLSRVCLDKLKMLINNRLESAISKSAIKMLNNKLKIINNFIDNNIPLDNLVIKVLPVIPAVLRPMVILDNTYTSSGLNEFYKNVIIANNNILSIFELFLNNGNISFKAYIETLNALQQAVDTLIDNSPDIESPLHYNTTALKSLSGLLKGKKGRFRNNLLGKRVDYSGRSVIAPGPDLLLYECAIPRIMALELFKPFIHCKIMLKYRINDIELVEDILANNLALKSNCLEEVVKYCPVILNRAPSLHKLSMRAFNIKLTNEKVIRLHPLTCSGFNADFDGDQMAVHVPLSLEAKLEVMLLMMATKSVLHPAHGGPCVLPTQDMIMGLYYMSLTSLECKDMCFDSYSEVSNALMFGKVTLHTKIKFIMRKNKDYVTIISTPGRLLIMETVPFKCNFVYEWSKPSFDKSLIINIIELVSSIYGKQRMIEFNNALMVLGFKYASQAGISLSRLDLMQQSKPKHLLIKQARLIINRIWLKSYLNHDERLIFRNLWLNILKHVYNSIDLVSPYYSKYQTAIQIMLNSGARGAISQIKQLICSRGIAIGFNGKPCGVPILRSYMEGLDLLHLFCCTYASRRGLITSALKTSSSGYLTRKLVEVTRECVINDIDCGTKIGLYVKPIWDLNFIKNRLIGRFLFKPIIYNKTIMLKPNDLITEYNIDIIFKYYNKHIGIRSPVTCCAKKGVCKLCYGIDLNSMKLPIIGTSIGSLAAQAIAEPGTQLTLKAFHGLEQIGNEKQYRQALEGCLQAYCSGIIKIIKLSCVCTFFGDLIISNTGCIISIIKDNAIVWKRKLSMGLYLIVSNGSYVEKGDVLCFNCLINNAYTCLVKGDLYLKDLIYNRNLNKTLNMQLNYYTNVKAYNNNANGLMPTIFIKSGIIALYFYIKAHKLKALLIKSSTRLNVFNALLNVPESRKDVIALFSEEQSASLSKLFENKAIESNCPIIACTNSVLRYGNTFKVSNANPNVYIIDPICVFKKPIVYHIYGSKCLLENNTILHHGRIIIPPPPSRGERLRTF